MSEFIRSTQATNSPRSVGRLGSRTRWIATAGDDPPRRRLLAATGQHVDLDPELGEALGELADVAGEAALDQRRVLPGEDETRVLARWGKGSSSGLRLRSGARLRMRGSGGSPESMASSSAQAWPVTRPERVVARLCGDRGTPSRSPGRRAARARRARPRVPARPGPRGRAAAAARAARRPGQVGHLGRVPRPQVLALAPGRGAQRSALGAWRSAASPSVIGSSPARRDLRAPLGEPLRPLPPPVPEQLGVDREHQRAPRPRAANRAAARRWRRRTRALLARARRPRPRGRRGRRRSPRGAPRQRLAVKVGVGRVGRVAVERPEPARSASQSIGNATGPASVAIGRIAPRAARGRSGRCRSSRARARRAAARGPGS